MASQLALNKPGLAASSKSAVSPSTRVAKVPLRQSHVAQAGKTHKGRWSGMDAGKDTSDDQQDIARGRGMVDELFQGWGGTAGTQNAIMSSTDYISQAQRSLNNIEDGFYISPAFLDKLSIHIAKNFMNLPKIKVPLILGIWGGKGQGKTFQCMLAFKKLGINPIVMSAGELESGNAGEPAKLIRQRYREASDLIKKGKMCALFINDLDAGAGRFGLATQYTVNNQMVNATLMNIADNPTNVQLPGVYKNEEIPRVPIICTGNDFSTLYAPLIRDGRMEKYYWNPTREDRVGVCMGIFMEDNLNRGEIESLVDAFPGQSIDFFGALRARVYDDKVREFVNSIGHENLNKRLINSREGKVTFEKPKMNLDILMKYGRALVDEQDNVKRVQLAEAYMAGAELGGSDGTSNAEDYIGSKGHNYAKQAPRAGWRSTPSREQSPAREAQAPPAPRQTPSAPAPSSGSSDRWANYNRGSSSSGGSSRGAPAPAPAGALSASDLAKFKIADLVEIAAKKGVSGGRNATRDSLTSMILKAGVKATDLTRGQLAELKSGDSSYPSLRSSSPSPAPAAAPSSSGDRWANVSRGRSSSTDDRSSSSSSSDRWAKYSRDSSSSSDRSSSEDRWANVNRDRSSSSERSSGGDRWASYSRGNSSSGDRSSSRGRSSSSGKSLSAGDLSAFKIVDLVEIAAKKGVSAGRNATRDALTDGLVRAGVTLSDLTYGQLADLGTKLGKAGLSRDLNSARAELEGLIGGSGSHPSSWRATPTPSASNNQSAPASWRSTPSSSSSSGDRWASYSRGSGGSSNASGAGGGSSGTKLSASALGVLPIDDLRDLCAKVGAELPRAPTKDGVINALVSKGVSLDHCSRGMLVALSTKLGAPLAKDVNGLKANLASRVGGGSSGSSTSNWRSSPTPSSSPAPASSGGDRWAKYSAGSTQNASWRRSGSHNASGSKLSASDLAVLRIDDLGDLVKKTGVEIPRQATKDGVISALVGKGVSLNELTRGMLVDLANNLGVPMARDVDSLRKSLASAVGKGGYSPASSSRSSSGGSSWRTPAESPAASSSNGSSDRWAKYSRGSSNGSGGRSSASGAVYEADLAGFKIDMLSDMARKIGIPMRNATKDSLVRQLAKTITLADLSRGQLIEILSNINQSTSGSVEDLRSRVAAASSQRQSARGRSLTKSRW